MLPSSLNMIACGLLRRTARRAALPEDLPSPVTFPSVFFRFSRTCMAVLALPEDNGPRGKPFRAAVRLHAAFLRRRDDAGRLRDAARGRRRRFRSLALRRR